MASLCGKWAYASHENLEEYMTATGVPDNLKDVARNSKPEMEIAQNGDQWTIKTTVGEKVKDTTFTLGAEFDSTALTGQPLKCTVTLDGSVLTEVQKAGEHVVKVTREVSGDELVTKMTFGDVTATVKFNRA